MFDFIEESSRLEQGLMALLAAAAGYVPSIALISFLAVGGQYDPKFGYLGSVQLVALLSSLVAVGATIGILGAAIAGVAARPVAHLVLGVLIAIGSFGLFRFLSDTDFLAGASVLARVLVAEIVMAAAVFVAELVWFRMSERGRSTRAAV